MNIYIIDDNEVDLIIGQKLLEKKHSGFQISVCQDPEAALQQIQEKVVRPDVILLDWFMPVLSAEDWLERYSRLESPHIPVYILTSSTNLRDKQKAEKYSMVKGFFSKPIKQQHIEEILANHSKT